jgi:predicted SnoaL-like aldol condensation-catalyzing enzyme
VQEQKQTAVQFLKLVVEGRIEEAYRTHVDENGKHHNPYFSAGFAALKQAMLEDHARNPNKEIRVKNVLGDADLVAVHSHLRRETEGGDMIVVHLFRFRKGKIVEMWDCGQPLPADSANADGAF